MIEPVKKLKSINGNYDIITLPNGSASPIRFKTLCRSQLVQKGVDRPFSGSINQQVKSDHDLPLTGG